MLLLVICFLVNREYIKTHQISIYFLFKNVKVIPLSSILNMKNLYKYPLLNYRIN